MKAELKEFLVWMLSVLIIFYSGGISFNLFINYESSFMQLLWIPFFIIGILLNINYLKHKKKEVKKNG